MSVLEKLNQHTYVVQHNPNCPHPFLIRMVGKGRGMIDNEPYGITKDRIGSGRTLEEAAEKVLAT